MSKLYAVSGTALQNTPYGVQASSFAGFVVRENRDEALGGALAMTRRRMPESEGYHSHGCLVAEAPDHILDLVRPQVNQKGQAQ